MRINKCKRVSLAYKFFASQRQLVFYIFLSLFYTFLAGLQCADLIAETLTSLPENKTLTAANTNTEFLGSQHSGFRLIGSNIEWDSNGYVRTSAIFSEKQRIQLSGNLWALLEQRLIINGAFQFELSKNLLVLTEILASAIWQLGPLGAQRLALGARLGLQWINNWGVSNLVLESPIVRMHQQFDSNFFKLQQSEYERISLEHIWLRTNIGDTHWGFFNSFYPAIGIYELGFSAYKLWPNGFNKLPLQLGYGLGIPLSGVPAQKISLFFILSFPL